MLTALSKMENIICWTKPTISYKKMSNKKILDKNPTKPFKVYENLSGKNINYQIIETPYNMFGSD